jgi:predicted homoserine dehydrogenase-like protein
VAEAVLLGEVTVTPEQMHAEVVCTAKHAIPAGTTLDGIGGIDWYGKIMTYPGARAVKAVPIGIGSGAVATRDIPAGATITEDDVTVDESTFVARLRRLQDALYS